VTKERTTGSHARRTFLGAAAAAGIVALTPASAGALTQAAVRVSGPATGTRPRARAATRAFIGGYTTGVPQPAPGIGLASVDPVTGALSVDSYYDGVQNPFYLAMHPSGNTLYAVSDVSDGRVYSMRVLPGGGLAPVNDQSSEGDQPVYLSVHPSGQYLLTANFGSGSVAVHPILPDGSLGAATDVVQQTGSGPDPTYQTGPHAHMTVTDPTGGRVLVPDLGNDYLYVYQFSLSDGTLTPESQVYVGAGAGPRHLVLHPSGRHVYLVDQLASTITIFGYDPWTGALWKTSAVSIVPPGTPSLNSPSAIRLSPDARYVYSPNRGLDAISILRVGDRGGSLTLVGLQRIDDLPLGDVLPYDLVIDPTGRYLYTANTQEGSVSMFTVDRATGALTQAGNDVAAPTPVCVLLA
jgi:6-phosphogluconolactonase